MSKRDQRGFTLLENMIAIAVLGIGVLAIGAMQMTATRNNTLSKDLTQGVALAQQQVEQIMAWDFDDVRLIDGDGANTGTGGLDDNPNALDPMNQQEPDERHPNNPFQGNGVAQVYNVYWNVADDHPVNNVKTIRVIVTWNDKGLWKNVSVDYIKAEI